MYTCKIGYTDRQTDRQADHEYPQVVVLENS